MYMHVGEYIQMFAIIPKDGETIEKAQAISTAEGKAAVRLHRSTV